METKNYPFFKLTLDEKFPRLLITRRPENKLDNQAIYGAFLPVGMARRMLDLLMRLFRLRPCELDIQGDFDAPCPEYFLHRCLAPCVSTICGREKYLESVEIVHLILSNQFELALKKIERKIERFSADLEFELAAEWQNIKLTVGEIAANAKWQINVSMMNDVITISREENFARVYLTTLRRGKSVGRLNFQVNGDESKSKIIADFIKDFYRFAAPKQIYVPNDFPERKILQNKLSEDFGRKIKIVAQPPGKLPASVFKTQKTASKTFLYENNNSFAKLENTLKDLKEIFGLEKIPRRIECFDVAHLAGKEMIAARVRAIDGILEKEDGLVWEFENLSEIAALAAAVRERLRLLPGEKEKPDLLVLDGAKPQINAVRKITEEFRSSEIIVIGAVKPTQAHNRISHFLTTENERVEFDNRSGAMFFLQNLRDAAHALANETHRELHSLVQIFANNDSTPQVKYLLVPTRYAERGGNADDLSPIRSMTQAGEIILKTKR